MEILHQYWYMGTALKPIVDPMSECPHCLDLNAITLRTTEIIIIISFLSSSRSSPKDAHRW